MPLDFRRFAPTGPRTPRETATLCNQIGENTATQIASMEARLDLLETLIQQMVISAGGAMDLVGGRVGADITGAYQAITNYTTVSQPVRGVSFNLLNGTFNIDPDLLGKWDIDLQIALTFSSTGASRSTNLRLFNVTDASAIGQPVAISVSSQDDSISLPVLIRAELLAGSASDDIRMEIGGGSTFTGVNWQTQLIAPFYKDRLTALVDPLA